MLREIDDIYFFHFIHKSCTNQIEQNIFAIILFAKAKADMTCVTTRVANYLVLAKFKCKENYKYLNYDNNKYKILVFMQKIIFWSF